MTECLAQWPVRLVMDVSAVSFCDAASLSTLIEARDSVQPAGTEFVLQGARTTLLRVLTITGLDAGFGLRPQHGPAPSPDSATP
ncbi:STAS domain-containing protein [Streptomyces sp. NPDC004561]